MRYPSKKEARYALLKCWTKGRSERGIYSCKFCGGFHLTSREEANT